MKAMEAPMKDDKTIYREFLEGSISAFETLVIEHKDNLTFNVKFSHPL